VVLLTSEDDFTTLTELNFVTAPKMILICLLIELVVQTFALVVEPTAWWTWQLLGFIVATNLGAVVLAVFAQRSADQLSNVYRRVFTPQFYQTMSSISQLQARFQAEAEAAGDDPADIDDMVSELYAAARSYLETKRIHDSTPLPELGVPHMTPGEVSLISESELFLSDDADSS